MDSDSNKKTTLSFGFSKKKEAPTLKGSVIREDEVVNEDTPDYVKLFDGKHLGSEKKKTLVIPLIHTNKWHVGVRPEDLEKDDEKEESREIKKVEGSTVEAQAANELIKEAISEQERWSKQGTRDSGIAVPLLMANKVPDGYETDDKLDVSLRPEGSVEADYEKIPIEEYGMAMLRGMGWKDGRGIGKNGKLVKPVNPVLRPKGMGLGADRSQAKQAQGVSGNADSGNRHLEMRKGSHCVITNGRQEGLYGTIQGLDEDNARIMLKMAISGDTITLNQFAVQLVTKKDFDKNSRVLNKSKVDKFKEEQGQKQQEQEHQGKDQARRDRDTKRHRDSHKERHKEKDRETNGNHDKLRQDREHIQEKDRKRKHDRDDRDQGHSKQKASSSEPSSRRQKMWLRPNLRVRIVDPEYKKGKYFKSKVIVEDVISHKQCICRTEEGRVLEELSQSMLETVIPRGDSSYVMIIRGEHLGKLALVLGRDAGACKAVVQLMEDRDLALSLDYDDLCEYTGNIDHEFDY